MTSSALARRGKMLVSNRGCEVIMEPARLIDEYLAGPRVLRTAVEGMSEEQLDAVPVPGKWSTRQVVCHLADFEPIYADRMKRVIAEEQPTFFGGDPDVFAARLAYAARDVEEELRLIEAVRGQLGRILRTLSAADFHREGIHSQDGPLSLRTLLERVTRHLPHHVQFIQAKRAALGGLVTSSPPPFAAPP
jgi:uncharacterized damage-inducible protein DinB